MSLTLSLNNALSGLKVSQQSFAVLSQNIANANNEDYTRQTVSQTTQNSGGAIGNGVQISAVNRIIDDYISRSVVNTGSNVSKAQSINSFYNELQVYIGQPGQNNSIDTYVNKFFDAISQLSITPERSSLKLNAVNAGVNLAQQISSLAGNVQKLRYDADTKLKQSLTNVNTELKKIYELNRAIISAQSNNQSINGLSDNILTSLKKISEEIDVTYKVEADNTVTVSTTNGVSLVGTSLSEFDYTAATSSDNFVNGIESGAITIYQLDQQGNRNGSPFEMVSAGKGDAVKSLIKSGNVAGLLEVRDKLLPDVISQLDSIASTIRDSVNAIHNDGTSYPPPQTLTGTTLVNPKASANWDGSVMIAVLDPNGLPISSPYNSDNASANGLAPLTLNLGKLNDGVSTGKPTYQAIIDEINEYYGIPQNRAKIGPLSNIELVSRSDSLTAGSGTFNFDLELTNLAANNASVRVTGASFSDPAASFTSPASFPSASFTAEAGKTGSTTGVLDFAVNMSGTSAGPYTVTLNVETTAADGTVSTGSVTYTINTATSALRNDRYAPASAGGQASIEAPNTNSPILTAKLVDKDGVEVQKDSTTGDYVGSGYLQLSGANGTYRVAINEMNSSFKGDYNARPAVAATSFGFSHQFGLNNFFVDNGKVDGAAVTMEVTKDIAENPQRVTIGELSLSNQPTTGTTKRYTYEIGSGSNQAITKLAELSQQNILFKSAGSLPSVSLTFSGYAAEILGFTAARTSDSKDVLTQSELINQGFEEKDKSVRGVNIDEEMANTIVYQNAYSANARVITVTKELFQDLIDAF